MPRTRMLSAALVTALSLLAVPAVAGAQSATDTGLFVTIAARSCPSYEAITANRARNNIQESLKDLGTDTAYPAGRPIDSDTEEANQPLCTPITNWSFTLGTGIITRAVSGPWGSLSIVTGAFSTDVTTKASIPLLNTAGQNTGRTLAGATTIELTRTQANLAAKSSALWIQGGTPADPILDQRFPGEYGFGALRCAIDNLNGDNVEWISIPQGSKHVFCYAYYVKPPPTSGTIIVRKEVDAPAGTVTNTWPFNGNISFNPDGSFTVPGAVGKPGQTTFYRAGGSTWSFRELVPAGWRLSALTCTSQTGGSTSQTDIATAAATVALASGDTVTCTYRDQLVPPPAGLVLSKVTLNGVGKFGFDLKGPENHSASATTTAPGQPFPALPAFGDLTPGDYTIDEDLPSSDRGKWRLTEARCDGQLVDTQPVRLTLTSGQGRACTFINTFTPKGTIILRKKTVGGVGTMSFVITTVPRIGTVGQYLQTATTKQEGVAVRATGDDTSNLPLGSYDIRETTPSVTKDGFWTAESAICNGEPVGSAQGRVRVVLTVDEPDIDCTVTNRFNKTPTPPDGGGGTPPSPPDSGVAGTTVDPTTNLVITKSVTPKRITSGQVAHYKVTVTNRGKVTATNVRGAELSPPGTEPLRLHASKGRCRGARPAICVIGTLKPGEHVTVTSDVRTPLVGRVVNRVAVTTATNETQLADNKAHATLLVRAKPPRFTG